MSEHLHAVARTAAAARAATLARDEAIRTAHAAGHAQREIARHAGLSHPGIAKILERSSPMRAWTLSADVTAGAMQSMLTDVMPGQIQPGVTQGRWCSVSAIGAEPPEWMLRLRDRLVADGTELTLD